MIPLVNPEAVLFTERLRLEPLVEGHAALLFPLLQDERLYHYIPQGPPASLAALAERYRRLQRRRSPAGDEAWLNWALRLVDSGEYVGRVEATVRPGPDPEALLAYEIGTAFWGRGHAAEACGRVLRLLFEDYAVREVSAQVDTENRRSIRLLERLGFRCAGLLPGADFFNGRSSDEYCYRLARPAKKI